MIFRAFMVKFSACFVQHTGHDRVFHVLIVEGGEGTCLDSSVDLNNGWFFGMKVSFGLVS